MGSCDLDTPDSIVNYLTVTIGFECNNNCVICMLRDARTELKPIAFEDYKLLLSKLRERKRVRSLILSGAEITTNSDFLKYAEYARDMKYFDWIRIQTNGRRLSDIDFCRQILAAGVNEFFVSIHGPDSRTHNAITRIPRSFEETWSGLLNLNSLNVRFITNTVITERNYKTLIRMVDRLAELKGLRSMEFWSYWPMCDFDKDNLVASNAEVQEYLIGALAAGDELGVDVFTKGFPHCLLGAYRVRASESMSPTLIGDRYWDRYRSNHFYRCIYRNICSATTCRGLTLAYVNKYGWDDHILSPIGPLKEGKSTGGAQL